MSETCYVKITEGFLRGKKCVSYNGTNYYSFQGIPYAKPPLGDLRFKAPEPAAKWQNVRDALQEGPPCYSRALMTPGIIGEEDCLYLNVYTPLINKPKERLPVMFWIHGGGFTSGSGSTELFGPEFLIDKHVVLITINYRLGVFGFPDPTLEVTGNAGLKDMVMALKWTKRNVSQFSGDPKNVTIFGESAGAAAVHYLTLSPTTKGLFHKAIMQSGCAMNCFTKSKYSYTYQLADLLGIDSHDDKFILAELRKVPTAELYKATTKIRDSYLVSDIRPFCPVIEPKGRSAFITENPIDIIKSGRYQKVPLIMGYNTLEGVLIYMLMKKHLERHFLTEGSLVPHTLKLRKNSPEYNSVAQSIKKVYNITGSESAEVTDHLEKAIQIYTHNFVMADMCRSARIQCKSCPVFFYRFDLDTKLNLMKRIAGIDFKGAAHADDLFYLFNNQIISIPPADTAEYQLIEKITTMWTNFAKHARPHATWHPHTEQEFPYLSIENQEFRMLKNPEKEYVDFWENLHEKTQHSSKL